MKKIIANNKDAQAKNIVIYQTKDKKIHLEAKIQEETIWLSQSQLAKLFKIDRTVITKHLGNIFKTKELNKNSVCAFFAHTAPDNKTYQTQYYNLDVIISLGYRVNSKRATQFRIWATQILKQHIVEGYTINQKRLLEETEKFRELQKTIAFIQGKAENKELAGQAQDLLHVLNQYAGSLTLLFEYDQGILKTSKLKKPSFVLTYEQCLKLILETKTVLINKKEARELFGQEYQAKFKSVIGSLYQTFGGKDLYPTVEEKAAHLLYLTIKDHPFADGNKRLASLLFIYFLERNKFLFKKSGERKITDTTLVALALLVAMSNPKEKEVMIKLITNLLK